MLRLDAACTSPPGPDPRPDTNNIDSEHLGMRQDTPNHPNETNRTLRSHRAPEIDAVASDPGDGSQMATPQVVQDAPHGTLRGWKMGCRCTCSHAANNADRDTTDDHTAIQRRALPNVRKRGHSERRLIATAGLTSAIDINHPVTTGHRCELGWT
jgi:hypothetical protein